MALTNNLTTYPVVIAAGQSLSAPLPIGAYRLVGIFMPAVWTAAGLTFQSSPDGGTTWGEVQDGTGNALALTVTPGIFVPIDPAKWSAINHWKFRSGTLAAPVAQTATATLLAIVNSEQW